MTLGDLFHRTAELVDPLCERLLHLIAEKEIVLADETTQRVQAKGKTRTAWLWSFIARDEAERELIAYVFSRSRLRRDARTRARGYDRQAARRRVRRLQQGHRARRARASRLLGSRAPEVLRGPVHRAGAREARDGLHPRAVQGRARRARCGPARQSRSTWPCAIRRAARSSASSRRGSKPSRGRHPPRSPIGVAINYALGQWGALTLFLTDAHLPLDNNASERALRVAALGRKNFLFVGTDEAGENLAGLYSLIATCEANGVNPVDYLADVLLRVQTHPAVRIDELLPHNWTPPRPEPSA